MTDSNESKVADTEALEDHLRAVSFISPESLRSILDDKKFHKSIRDKFGDQRIMIVIDSGKSVKITVLTNIDEIRESVPEVAEAFDTYKLENEVVFLIMESDSITVETCQTCDPQGDPEKS